MRLHDGLDTWLLLQNLRRDLAVEEQWKPLIFPSSMGAGSVLSIEDRNATARWLLAVNTSFNFYPETYVLGVSLFDTFIKSVKVNARYFRCIGVACLYIAAKIQQENESVPSAAELVAGADCSFSVSDLRRMELLVLDKLDWSPTRATALTLLHVFHALLLRSSPDMAASAQELSPRDPTGASRLLQAMLNLTASGLATRYSPCSLALALLSLQAAAWLPRTWLGPMLGLVALTQKSPRELAECRETVASQPWLHFISRPPILANKPYSLNGLDAPQQSRTPKRKAVDDDMDDDVYECIKRLYADDTGPTCAARLHNRITDQLEDSLAKA